jgi:uncharacterized repeat protein (TIGR01451 family)
MKIYINSRFLLFIMAVLLTGLFSQTVSAQVNAPVFTAVAVCTGAGLGQYNVEVTLTDLGDDTNMDNAVTLSSTGIANVVANATGTFILGPFTYTGTGTATPTITATNNGEAVSSSQLVSEVVCGIPQAQASCDCSVPEPNGVILAQVAPGSFDPAVSEMVYVLVDAAGNVVASNQTGLFEGLINGDYEVHAYNFVLGSASLPASGTDFATWEAGLPAGVCFAACAAWPFTVDCACCVADAGNIVIPTDVPTVTDGNTITICQGTEINAFSVTYAQTDETDPTTLGAGYDLRYILADATGEILQFNADGNFSTAGLIAGTYDIFVLSYKETTNLFTNIDTYLALIDLTYNGGDIAAIVADDNDMSSYGLSQGSTPIADPATLGTFCLDLDQLDNDGLDADSEKVQIIINDTPVCSIGGTMTVCPSSTGNVYTAPAGMTTYAWSASGNGTIIGANNSASVTVTAGSNCSDFTLSLTILDPSGCTSSCNQLVEVNDATPPTIQNCAVITANGPVNLGCTTTAPTAAIALAAMGTISDNCTLSGAPVVIPGSITGTCIKSQTFTVTATDLCGNTASCSITYNWSDDITPPTFPLCADGIPGNNTISLGCNPTAAQIPTDATAIAAVGIPTDNCGVNLSTLNAILTSNTVSGCLTTQVWTVSVTDACNNTGSCAVTYTWTIDTTPPTFANCTDGNSANNIVDLGCNPATLPNGATAILAAGIVTEGCGLGGNTPTASISSTSTAGCVTTQVWTVSVTDACDNIGTCSITYTWTTDAVAPTFPLCTDGNPANNISALGCNPSTLPNASMAIGLVGTPADNCGVNSSTLSALGASEVISGCSHSQVWTVSVTDACNNTGSCAVTYTWTTDTTTPTFANCTDGNSANNIVDLGCNPATLPNGATAILAAGIVTEGCGLGGNTPTASISSTSTAGCVTTQVWTVSVTDACGNTGSCAVTYTWTIDTTAPTFPLCADGIPGNNTISLGCNPTAAQIPTDATAILAVGIPTEGCGLGGNMPSAVLSSNTTLGCVTTQVWTVSVTDACGNTGSCAVTYTWTIDTTAPTFPLCADGIPGNNIISLGCNPTAAQIPTDATAILAVGIPTEGCGLGVNMPSAVLTSNTILGCVTTQVWTVSVIDACGNTGSCAVTYTWTIDTTAPTFPLCADGNTSNNTISLGCNPSTLPSASMALGSVGTPTEGCGLGGNMPSAALTSNTTSGCVTTQVWVVSVTDACGNTGSCEVTYTYTTDSTAPTFALCTDGNLANNTISLGCNPTTLPTSAMAIADVGAVTETCGFGANVPSAVQTSTVTVGCLTTEVWTVSVTDVCGNTGSCQVTYTYTIDSTAPVFAVCPANLLLTCDGSYTADINDWLATASATDACGATVTNNLTPATIAALTCDAGSVTVTFTATDACGNTSICSSQVVFVQTPSIQLYKAISSITDVNGDNITGVGDIINYAFTVTNTGNVTLTNITLSDPLIFELGGPLASLAPGASNSTTFTGIYIITQADVNTGYVENTATATGTDPNGDPVTDISDAGDDTTETGDGDGDTNGDPTDDPTVQPLDQNPAIQLYKYVNNVTDTNGNGYTDAGDIVHYRFTVTNTGNVTLTNVTVTDPLVTVVGGPIPTLAIGASNSTTFTATYTIMAADVTVGYVENTATATGTDPNGDPVNDTSDTGDDTTETGDGDGDTNGDPTDDPTIVVTVPACTANVSDIPDQEICQGDVTADNNLSFPLEPYNTVYGAAPVPEALYSLSYILTDVAGNILQVSHQGAPYNTISNVPTFTYSGLAAGNYRVYEVIYLTSEGPLTNTSAGMSINAVGLTTGSTCLDATFADLFVHPAPSVVSLTANSPICTGDDLLIDLQATNVTVNGIPGYPIASYQWDLPVGANIIAEDVMINNVTTANVGIYTVTITDGLGCTTITSTNVVVNTTPTLAEVHTNLSCNGDTDGSITITPNPAGVYTYTWSAGSSITNTATGLAAGTYTVTVSANGCSATTSVTITQPTALTASIINVAQPTCSGGVSADNGGATVSPVGGTMPYTYLWTNGATTATISNLAPGTYSVTVTDLNNCTVVLANALVLATPSCCTANVSDIPDEEICQGDATANNNLGFPLEQYNIVYGAAPTPANLYSLSYILTTTTGTIMQVSHQGAPYNAVSTVPTFTYSGLAAGNYRVYEVIYLTSEGPLTSTAIGSSINSVGLTTGSTCLDATFADLFVHPAPSVASLTANSPICTGDDLLIDLQASNVTVNGVPGYPIASYQWDLPVGANIIAEDVMINNVTTANAGTYTVTITDGLGCTTITSTNVVVNTTPTLAEVHTNLSCNGDTDGSITITPNPAGVYTYTWSAGGSTTNSATGLAAGTYTVTVSANGCSATTSATITQPIALTASIINVAQPTCSAGVATNNGAGTVSVSGGTAPYTYLWTGGTTTATISNLAPGTYSVTVTDLNNCTLVLANALVLNTPDCCTANVSDIPDQEICQGYAGSLNFPLEPYSVLYGAAPAPAALYSLTYVLTTSGGSILQFADMGAPYNTVSNTPPFTYSGLAAGNYRVYEIIWRTADGPLVGLTAGGNIAVVDVTNASSNCLDSTFGDLYINPTPLATADSNSPICAGEDLLLVATGGVSYAWSTTATAPFSSTANFDVINNATASNAGTYTVTVTDANGCSATDNTVAVINTVTASISASATTTCAGSPITLTAVGTGTYMWSNGETTAAISASTTGTYTVTVTGAGGCTASASQAITVNSVSASIVPFGPTTFCVGGSVSLLATGGGTYLWSTGATNAAITATTTGTYTVTVTNNGCTAVVAQSVTAQGVTASILAGGPTTFCAGGSVDLSVAGLGTYQWNTGATTANITATSTGVYSVTVTNNGCTATASQAVTVNSVAASITPFGPTEFCAGGSLTLLAGGGTNYLWNNTATSTTAAITVTTSNTYTVTVTGAGGCTTTQSVVVTVNPLPVVNAGADVTICDGVATQLGAAQVADMTYSWGPSGGLSATNIAQPLASPSTTTTYGLTMTNTLTGCTANDNVLVTVNPTPTASASNNGPLCDTRDIILIATGGFGYQWSGPNGYTASTATATVLSTSPSFPGPGTWTYTVTVSNGNCSATASTTVVVNDSPNITLSSNAPLCAGSALQLTSNYSNATTNDVYQWSGPLGFSSSLPSPTIANVTPQNAGTYTLLVANQYGCTSAATIAVAVNALPNVTISSGTTCSGGLTNLSIWVPNAGLGATYAWSGTGVGTGNNQTVNGLSAGSQTYSVTITNSLGCTASSTTTIVIPSCYVCNAQAGTVQVNNGCINEPITATVSGNTTSGGFTTQFIVANSAGTIVYVGNSPIPAQAAGSYTVYSYNYSSAPTTAPAIGMAVAPYVFGTVSGGCYDVSDSGTAMTIYNGSPVLVSMQNVNEGNTGGISPFYYTIDEVLVEGGSIPYNFNWDNNGYVRYDIQYGDHDGDGIEDAFITIYYADNANWACTITDDVTCGGTGEVIFTNVPGVDTNPILDIDNYVITPESSTSSNGAITLYVSGGTPCAAPNSYTYQWAGPTTWTGAAAASGGGGATETITGLPWGWYSVTVTDCSGQTTEGWYWVPRARRGRSKVEESVVAVSAMPNPFNDLTTIEFQTTQDGMATVEVYAVDGKRVATLYNDWVVADELYSVQLSADNLPAGVYTVVLSTDKGERNTYRLLLTK